MLFSKQIMGCPLDLLGIILATLFPYQGKLVRGAEIFEACGRVFRHAYSCWSASPVYDVHSLAHFFVAFFSARKPARRRRLTASASEAIRAAKRYSRTASHRLSGSVTLLRVF